MKKILNFAIGVDAIATYNYTFIFTIILRCYVFVLLVIVYYIFKLHVTFLVHLLTSAIEKHF